MLRAHMGTVMKLRACERRHLAASVVPDLLKYLGNVEGPYKEYARDFVYRVYIYNII